MKVHNNSFCSKCGQSLEGSEYLCPSCGLKLAETPVSQTPPPVNDNVPPPIKEGTTPEANQPQEMQTPPSAQTQPQTQTPPQKQPQQVPPTTPQQPQGQTPPPQGTPPPPQQAQTPPPPQGYQQAPYPMPPRRKKSKAWLWILIILLLLLGGVGAGAFLIYNGTIPKEKVDFLPEQVLEMLTPKQNSPEPTVSNKPSKVFYLAYSSSYLEKTNEKVIIISSVMDPGSVSQSNEFGAKNAFNEFARINYPKDYFLFKNVVVRKFDTREDAVNKREKIKKEYKSKGYTLRLMEVVYSIK